MYNFSATTTDQSISSLSTSPESPSDSISTDVDESEIDDTRNISQLGHSGRFNNVKISVKHFYPLIYINNLINV